MTGEPREPVLVLGVGNILRRDDGVGVRVVESLDVAPLPDGLELFDGATAGLDLVNAIAHRDRVVIVDAVDCEGEPGTVIRWVNPQSVRDTGATLSLHELGPLQAMDVARRLGVAPQEVVVVGIKPADTTAGLELSPQVQRILPFVRELVLAEATGRRQTPCDA